MTGWAASHGETAVRVLLVEDNPGDARLVRILLTENNDRPYLVTHVTSLHEALALAGNGAAFDVVLTDLGLPDSSGTDTVDALLGGWSDCPLVVLTGLADHETGIRAVQRGCQDYLVKGFDDPELLQRTIRYAIERSTVARELRESEERFRTLIEVSPEAILLCTGHKVVFANPAAVATFRAGRRQDLMGMDLHRLFSDGSLDKITAAVEGVHRAAVRFECSLQRMDEDGFEAELTVAAITHRGHPAAELFVRDITERKLAERQYRLTAAVFETTDEAMMVTDADNRIVTVNPAFERVTGYSAAEVLGETPHILSSGRHSPPFYSEMWNQLLGSGHWHGEVWNRRKNGEVYVQRVTLSLIRDAEGKLINHVGVFSDVTDEKQEAERIRYRASYDALTGLPNRSLLHDRLQQALAKAVREQGMLAVLFLDLDGFKPVNDRLGHLAGDQLLMAVAERLHGCVRESDTVARLGGDEFVIVLPDVAAPEDAAIVAGKVVQSLQEPFELEKATAQIGTSIGIALFPENGTTSEDLIAAADRAMYLAKQAGKARYVMAQGAE